MGMLKKNRAGNTRFMVLAAVDFRGRPSLMQLHHVGQAGFEPHNTHRYYTMCRAVTDHALCCVCTTGATHTHTHQQLIAELTIFWFSPRTNEPPCLLTLPAPNYLLTSVNPCIPNRPDPQPSTSHLLLPCPLLYYPAGIALGTLQSWDLTPVTPSDRRGEQRTMTCCEGGSLVLRVFVALLLREQKSELKWKIKGNFLFPFPERQANGRLRISFIHTTPGKKSLYFMTPSCLTSLRFSQIPHCGVY